MKIKTKGYIETHSLKDQLLGGLSLLITGRVKGTISLNLGKKVLRNIEREIARKEKRI